MDDHSALHGLSETQLATLRSFIHQGAGDASEALSKWLHTPSVITVDALDLLPLAQATEALGTGGEPICFCAMEMLGLLRGSLVFAFDDASGLALADLVLQREPSNDSEWGEIETSAALETANVIGCAYLNSLQRQLADEGDSAGLLPSPPTFQRDFAECLLEFALMSQAMQSDVVLFSEARFEVGGTNLDWTLLLIPDADSINKLRLAL